MKHTPGPWKANLHMIGDDPRWFIQFDGIVKNATIAAMNSVCMVYDNPEADARLIAAAPELLEACRDALKALDYKIKQIPSHLLDGRLGDSCIKLKAVIARAEGRQ